MKRLIDPNTATLQDALELVENAGEILFHRGCEKVIAGSQVVGCLALEWDRVRATPKSRKGLRVPASTSRPNTSNMCSECAAAELLTRTELFLRLALK